MSADCIGQYLNRQGECERCPLALLCIDTAIELDGYYDELADRQREIEEMESDDDWRYE
jgi:hypothetical protein